MGKLLADACEESYSILPFNCLSAYWVLMQHMPQRFRKKIPGYYSLTHTECYFLRINEYNYLSKTMNTVDASIL